MPNWVENDLTLTGAGVEEIVGEISVLNEETQTEGISFYKFHPTPPELRTATSPNTDPDKSKLMIQKYGSADWYEWNIANWGTKWDATPNGEWGINAKGNKAKCSFSTAWGPPSYAIFRLSQLYPHLRIQLRYYEGAMGFAGALTLKNGKTLLCTHRDNYRGERGG